MLTLILTDVLLFLLAMGFGLGNKSLLHYVYSDLLALEVAIVLHCYSVFRRALLSQVMHGLPRFQVDLKTARIASHLRQHLSEV